MRSSPYSSRTLCHRCARPRPPPRSASTHLPLSAIEAQSIRRTLFKSLKVHPKSPEAIRATDEIIRRRLEGQLTRFGVQKALNRPVKKGGAGMRLLAAVRFSRKFELLMPASPKKP